MKMLSLILVAALACVAQIGWAQPAAASGKNYAGVNIEAMPARGTAGRTISVEVRYSGLPAAGHVQVTYTTEGALRLSGPDRKALSPDSKGTYRDTVVVGAAADGAYFLNAFVRTASGTSVVSIPVTVGNGAFKPRPAVARAASVASTGSAPVARHVIEMPAQETRR